MDAPDMESVAHRVRYYWQNFLDPLVLQEAMPKMMVPTPTLQSILLPHHYSCTPGHTDTRPFAPQNVAGEERVCMPTVVSFTRSNAYRTQPNGSAGEGEIFNTPARRWEEPDCRQKELMMG